MHFGHEKLFEKHPQPHCQISSKSLNNNVKEKKTGLNVHEVLGSNNISDPRLGMVNILF
jgi:hypothetical protein